MKNKLILISAMLVTSIAVSAQTWSTGTSSLYVNPTSTKVGIGVTNPQYKLDVNGKMYLHTVDWRDGMANSYLQWECHRLVMGVRDNFYAHTVVDIMPGGSSQGELYSQLSLYEALNETTKVETIRLRTDANSWINNDAYFGLGTNAPLCKLDVRGTIRANEILVNTVSGADFVFDKDYNLRPLSEVNTYIQENRHLPEIPSAADMKENGVSLDKLVIQLLQKVEELTLYTIQLEEKINELENQK